MDPPPVTGTGEVPCLYCRMPIPSASFSYWSPSGRLVSGDCPSCERRTTLASETWHRWGGRSAQEYS